MSEYTPGIYRGQSAGCFGLWRLTRGGSWLFSMPVNGDTWHPARLPQDELDGLVMIAADTDTGPVAAHDAEVRAQALVVTDEMVERAAVALWSQAAKGTLQPNYPWDGITAELREQFRVHARAALEAAFRENGSSDS